MSIFDETYLILYGKSGQGKVATHYKMLTDEKLSYQYFEKGEAIVIEKPPKEEVKGLMAALQETLKQLEKK